MSTLGVSIDTAVRPICVSVIATVVVVTLRTRVALISVNFFRPRRKISDAEYHIQRLRVLTQECKL